MDQPRTPVIDRLLNDWQRNFPLVPQPFAHIGVLLGLSEAEVLAALRALVSEGLISRVGGVVRPNTLGASTLTAMAVPACEVGRVADILVALPGVNHVYLRENEWNLWSVVTGPDSAYVSSTLALLSRKSGLRVLDLRLERPFHIDLGFALNGASTRVAGIRHATLQKTAFVAEAGDCELVQHLTRGLPLTARPFRDLGIALARSEDDVIARLAALVAHGVVPRIGVIVRHRALGWRSNAMVVWDVPEHDLQRAGERLAACPGITLCYQRTRHADVWPYALYCMVHAMSRADALDHMTRAEREAGLQNYPRQILFSNRCFKQTGALVTAPKEAA